MPKIWQITPENHRAVIRVMSDKNQARIDRRRSWGYDPAYIFAVSRTSRNGIDIGEVKEWLEDAGIAHWIEPAGSVTLVEFKSECDAVAFKLRWV